MTVTKVDGIERFATMQHDLLDTSADLTPCPICGSPAGYRPDPQHRGYLRAECANTSCGIATPFHYKTREDAAYAWNRRPADPPKRCSPSKSDVYPCSYPGCGAADGSMCRHWPRR